MDQLNLANNLVSENQGEENETTQYIVVRLGQEQYGIDIKYVENIVRMQQITRVPKVPSYIKGVINLRGEVIPVMSIRIRMGLPEDEITRATRIIILKLEQDGTVGYLVDEVKEVVTLESRDIEKMSRDTLDTSQNFINGVGKRGNELISLLDLNSISIEDNIG